MGMELTIVGSGSAFSLDNPAGCAVRLGSRLVLLDLGFGNLRALRRAGLAPRALTDVFFSHRHPDHVGDLPALLFTLRYEGKPRSGRLRLWGPPGFAAFVRRLRAAHAPWLDPRGYRLEVREYKPRQDADGLSVETLEVPHETAARALRLSYKGKSLVYSGDTGFCPALADFAAEADLFLLECTVTEKEGYPGHLTPRQALAILEASSCGKGVLTHLSPGTRAILSKKRLPRNVSLARDLRRFRI